MNKTSAATSTAKQFFVLNFPCSNYITASLSWLDIETDTEFVPGVAPGARTAKMGFCYWFGLAPGLEHSFKLLCNKKWDANNPCHAVASWLIKLSPTIGCGEALPASGDIVAAMLPHHGTDNGGATWVLPGAPEGYEKERTSSGPWNAPLKSWPKHQRAPRTAVKEILNFCSHVACVDKNQMQNCELLNYSNEFTVAPGFLCEDESLTLW